MRFLNHFLPALCALLLPLAAQASPEADQGQAQAERVEAKEKPDSVEGKAQAEGDEVKEEAEGDEEKEEAEDTGPLAAAREARAQFQQAVEAARQSFTEQVEQAHERHIDRLRTLAERSRREGNPDVAIQLREKRMRLERQGPPSALAAPLAVNEAPANGEDPGKKIDRPIGGSSGPTWKQFLADQAKVRVENIGSIPLAEAEQAGDWLNMPGFLKKHGGVVYSKDSEKAGFVRFTVERSGYIMLACHYGYQGSSGGWTEQRLDAVDMLRDGWQHVDGSIFEKPLKARAQRKQVLFYKLVYRGEDYRVRCNKYDPPFLFHFP